MVTIIWKFLTLLKPKGAFGELLQRWYPQRDYTMGGDLEGEAPQKNFGILNIITRKFSFKREGFAQRILILKSSTMGEGVGRRFY